MTAFPSIFFDQANAGAGMVRAAQAQALARQQEERQAQAQAAQLALAQRRLANDENEYADERADLATDRAAGRAGVGLLSAFNSYLTDRAPYDTDQLAGPVQHETFADVPGVQGMLDTADPRAAGAVLGQERERISDRIEREMRLQQSEKRLRVLIEEQQNWPEGSEGHRLIGQEIQRARSRLDAPLMSGADFRSATSDLQNRDQQALLEQYRRTGVPPPGLNLTLSGVQSMLGRDARAGQQGQAAEAKAYITAATAIEKLVDQAAELAIDPDEEEITDPFTGESLTLTAATNRAAQYRAAAARAQSGGTLGAPGAPGDVGANPAIQPGTPDLPNTDRAREIKAQLDRVQGIIQQLRGGVPR